jgi:hypothetical protein
MKYMTVETIEEGNKLVKLFESNIVKYLDIQYSTIGRDKLEKILTKLKKIDVNILNECSNIEIYNAYGLTQDEIDLIEKTIQ